MESFTVAHPELEQIQRIGGADLVIGLLDPDIEDVSSFAGVLHEALGTLKTAVRAVVLCKRLPAEADSSRSPEPPEGESSPVTFLTLPEPETANASLQDLRESYQTVLTVGGKLGARACGVIGSELRMASTQPVIYRLIQPLLELGFDLVLPRYDRQKTEGLLNRSIIAPLIRALYGARIQNPMGPDFGLSGRLLQTIIEHNSSKSRAFQVHPVASIVSTAVSQGFQICESYLGTRVQPATRWTDLSSLLAIVLGPVFLDIEQNAPLWQRIRGSKPVPWFGGPESVSSESRVVAAQPMIESFHLGAENFLDIWGNVLPPTTLLDLKRLARLPAAQFRMPDDLWASVVYDFVLGHRLRTISRDHLLRSMTPLYRGWIASYTIEMENAGPREVESRLEQLSAVFETSKPYLLSRWRWPDRFNP